MTIPSVKQSKEGYPLAIRNAKRLISCGELLADKGHYGPATSLTVLAAEEAIKSFILIMVSEGFEVEPSSIRQFMKRHKPRHTVGALWVLISFILEKWMNLISSLEEKHPDHGEAYAKERKEEVLILATELNAMADASPGEYSLIDELDWWRDSDETKQKGFYVDFDQYGWSIPNSFDENDFEEARNAANKALGYAETASHYIDTIPGDERQRFLDEMKMLIEQSQGNNKG